MLSYLRSLSYNRVVIYTVSCFLFVFTSGINVLAQPVKTSSGILITSGGQKIELAVVKDAAFRISVSTSTPKAITSVFLDNEKSTPSKYSVINESPVYGIKTSFGEVLFNTSSNTWSLFDASGKPLIAEGHFTVTDSSESISFPTGKDAKLYGSGNRSTKQLIKHRSESATGNGAADIPYLWSSQQYSALGITNNDNLPAQWNAKSTSTITWNFTGNQADLYIWPAKTLYAAAEGFARLTGKPKLPPLWAFGYLQSQWGWKDRDYIEDVLNKFRSHQLPVDAFIYDFEWYTTTPDYTIGKKGEKSFTDFSFNPKLFPDPSQQIANYKKQGVEFIGIRKPRLGNTFSLDTARKNGWLIHPESDSRDLNFSIPSLQKWYANQTIPLLNAGVDAWWNDEGESYYSCYYWWNLAESNILMKVKPNERHFSINRSFAPGNQRLGYCTWNGDIPSTWQALRETPADLLNFGLAGMNYGSCDIGGFMGTPTKENLVRWFQAGVFFPIMRAHSNLFTTPRFPWLWDADGEAAIRKALNLRYRLIPYLYSLGHEAYNTGIPMMRPLIMEFPNDSAVVNLTDEWLMGKGLLAAPILDSGGKRNVYLPGDTWWIDFNTNEAIRGPKKLEVTKALDEIPIYVRAGTILPLGPVVQYTGQEAMAPLEIRIYPGSNCSFIMTEDDGHTYNYTKGLVRQTTYTWNDATKKLSWKVSGSYTGSNVYKTIRIVLGNASKTVIIGKEGSKQFK